MSDDHSPTSTPDTRGLTIGVSPKGLSAKSLTVSTGVNGISLSRNLTYDGTQSLSLQQHMRDSRPDRLIT